jgi:hypothetical protein
MGRKLVLVVCELASFLYCSAPYIRSGTVFKGTWNRTEVAIKLVHNHSGVSASAVVRALVVSGSSQLTPSYSQLLRKEIDVNRYSILVY